MSAPRYLVRLFSSGIPNWFGDNPDINDLAKKAFAATAAYDRAVSAKHSQIPPTNEALPAMLDVRVPRTLALRYGENPHQSAALYTSGRAGIAGAEQL